MNTSTVYVLLRGTDVLGVYTSPYMLEVGKSKFKTWDKIEMKYLDYT